MFWGCFIPLAAPLAWTICLMLNQLEIILSRSVWILPPNQNVNTKWFLLFKRDEIPQQVADEILKEAEIEKIEKEAFYQVGLKSSSVISRLSPGGMPQLFTNCRTNFCFGVGNMFLGWCFHDWNGQFHNWNVLNRTVLGLGPSLQNVLVFWGLQHATACHSKHLTCMSSPLHIKQDNSDNTRHLLWSSNCQLIFTSEKNT